MEAIQSSDRADVEGGSMCGEGEVGGACVGRERWGEHVWGGRGGGGACVGREHV